LSDVTQCITGHYLVDQHTVSLRATGFRGAEFKEKKQTHQHARKECSVVRYARGPKITPHTQNVGLHSSYVKKSNSFKCLDISVPVDFWRTISNNWATDSKRDNE
jgi:hypothetical protein